MLLDAVAIPADPDSRVHVKFNSVHNKLEALAKLVSSPYSDLEQEVYWLRYIANSVFKIEYDLLKMFWCTLMMCNFFSVYEDYVSCYNIRLFFRILFHIHCCFSPNPNWR